MTLLRRRKQNQTINIPIFVAAPFLFLFCTVVRLLSVILGPYSNQPFQAYHRGLDSHLQGLHQLSTRADGVFRSSNDPRKDSHAGRNRGRYSPRGPHDGSWFFLHHKNLPLTRFNQVYRTLMIWQLNYWIIVLPSLTLIGTIGMSSL
jgi:hypothetical protein